MFDKIGRVHTIRKYKNYNIVCVNSFLNNNVTQTFQQQITSFYNCLACKNYVMRHSF